MQEGRKPVAAEELGPLRTLNRQPVDCYHLSSSVECTVALHVTALLVLGLELQNPTLGKDSFTKQIPQLLTQYWGPRRSRPGGERCHGLGCEEVVDVSG